MQTIKSGPDPQIETIIDVDAELHGDITFSGQLRLDGCIVGNVSVDDVVTNAMIVIGSKGRVTGNITVPYVVSFGQVTGNVEASVLLKLMPDAVIQGDVHYGDIEIEPGARIQGSLCPIYGDLAVNSV